MTNRETPISRKTVLQTLPRKFLRQENLHRASIPSNTTATSFNNSLNRAIRLLSRILNNSYSMPEKLEYRNVFICKPCDFIRIYPIHFDKQVDLANHSLILAKINNLSTCTFRKVQEYAENFKRLVVGMEQKRNLKNILLRYKLQMQILTKRQADTIHLLSFENNIE